MHNLAVDHARDALLTDFGKITLRDRYLQSGESFQDVFARASQAFSGGDTALAQRLYDYSSRLWFSFATPLIANGGTVRGLPISCFLNHVDDSIVGLAENFRENAFLSTNGGGIGTYWGGVRSVGEKTSRGVETPGVMPFMHVQDAQALAYHQGSTRRGAHAVYMDISHPEIVEFIKMRQSTGGDVHRKNENLHHGVVISDAFMEAVENKGLWDLVDPHSRQVKDTVEAFALWRLLCEQRHRLGEPYLFFVDAANRALPEELKRRGLRVYHSNLCTEITLPTAPDRTAVCCLSSINLAKYREWEPVAEQFISDLITMLDNVLDVFIQEAPDEMWRAVNSAIQERSLGLGTLGWSTLLQQEGLCPEDQETRTLNRELYSRIQDLAVAQSARLAVERGEAPDMKGSGRRNAHLLAVAPNATSSVICGGVSPSVEPMASNAFTQKTQSGSHLVKNPALIPVLQAHGQDDDATWRSIIQARGSVQHLDFLSEREKRVFRTAIESDQMVAIELACDRQPYICQAQSLNLFFPSDVAGSVLHKTHMAAWKGGLKSLYYLRSESVRATELVTKAAVEEKPAPSCQLGSDCVSCEA